jgi:hypothetical protein
VFKFNRGAYMPHPQVRGSIANGTSKDRDPYDFYETPQGFICELLRRQKFRRGVWEPTGSAGAISKVLTEAGYQVLATDICPRSCLVRQADFLEAAHAPGRDIVINPPFRLAVPFNTRGFELCHAKLAVVMPISGLNSSSRYKANLVEAAV